MNRPQESREFNHYEVIKKELEGITLDIPEKKFRLSF